MLKFTEEERRFCCFLNDFGALRASANDASEGDGVRGPQLCWSKNICFVTSPHLAPGGRGVLCVMLKFLKKKFVDDSGAL
jgi:hypothetical protein